MALAVTAHPPPALDARLFREALGRFATGVAFVTAAPDGKPIGLIVNSLTSVSLEPPLISFCPARSSLTWACMRKTGRFGVNVLRRQHERFVIRADAVTTLECEIVAEHPAGDHWIVIGRVDDLRISLNTDPLVFFAGAFGTLQELTSMPCRRCVAGKAGPCGLSHSVD